MKLTSFIFSSGFVIFGMAITTAHALEDTPASAPKMPPHAAQQPGPVQLVDLKKQLDANFAMMDSNHDGSISLAELSANRAANLERQRKAAESRRSEVFNRLDTNKDGNLSRSEWEAGNMMPPPPPVDASKTFARLDSNKDNKLSAQELQAPALGDFAKRDVDKNGILSGQELRPLPAKK